MSGPSSSQLKASGIIPSLFPPIFSILFVVLVWCLRGFIFLLNQAPDDFLGQVDERGSELLWW
jgi:hypothetical protein